MADAEIDRLAELVVDQHGAFEQALAGSLRRYPKKFEPSPMKEERGRARSGDGDLIRAQALG
jgi:hypothetical protein